MEHDIIDLIVEKFNTNYPWLLDEQKRFGKQIASKALEDIHCIQIGDVFIPSHIPKWMGVDVVCRGRTVFKDAYIAASMCLAISSLLSQISSGELVSKNADYEDTLSDLHQLITDYYECLPEARWIENKITDDLF